jgi:radical SAM protein with 4Fe4S-binding SPASM domain
VCRKLRDHGFGRAKEECASCKELPLCGGGCPLDDGAPGKEAAS